MFNISLRLSAGDQLAVVGPSGAGKSLLLRALAVLDPFDGQLLHRNTLIRAEGVPRYRSQAVLLPQQASLLPGRVEAALREPFGFHANRGLPWDHEYMRLLLRRIGREHDFLEKQTGDLSGGERQIATWLRAMALRPSVLLLDEPTSAIDAETTRRVEVVLKDWASEAERAYAWVTHDRAQAERIANRMIEVRQGRIVSDTDG